MQVQKRNGYESPVQFDEITVRIGKLLSPRLKSIIDPAKIAQNIITRIYDGITTSELDELSAQYCMSKVTEHPYYGELASLISISNHIKNTESSFTKTMQILHDNVDVLGNNAPLICKELLEFSKKNEDFINSCIDYDREFLMDYFAFKTLEKGYLLKINKKPVERIQHMFMRVALAIHMPDLKEVKNTYDNLSTKCYTHATPTLFHAGTCRQQLASCFLMGTEDSVEGIFKSISDTAMISKWAGGIGLHCSNIRSKNSYIRKTGGYSDGIMPMLKVYNDTARYINQGGKRLGSFALYLEPWHADIFAFLNAKKNHGAEEDRARDLFYALWIPDIFMERIQKDEEWTLLCPDECPGLCDSYGENFKELYIHYENDPKKVKKRIKAREVWGAITSCQIETGMPYMCYKDAANKKSNQKNIGVIKSSNLCAEVMLFSNENEYATCNLASICLPSILREVNNTDLENAGLLSSSSIIIYGKEKCDYCKMVKSDLKRLGLKFKCPEIDNTMEFLKTHNLKTVPQIVVDGKLIGGYTDLWEIICPKIDFNKLQNLTSSLVNNLNRVIDINFYPTNETKISNMAHRPIGIGVQGLADFFIRLRLPYTSTKAKKLNRALFETMYFAALSASHSLSKKYGPYSSFKGSPLSKGMFQFDLWDEKPILSGLYDWESLRENIKHDGVRNSVLIALMPTASTSQIMHNNETFEPYTSNIYKRTTLAGEFTVINDHLIKDLLDLELWNKDTLNQIIYDRGSVKNIKELPKLFKDIYKTVWELSQKEYITMAADRGRFVCQSQSLNLWFEKPTPKILFHAHLHGWKSGLKTGSYYIRSKPALNAQTFSIDPSKEVALIKDDECLMCSA